MSTTTLMTFAEFGTLPEMPGKQELIYGVLTTVPPPDDQHSIASIMIVQELLKLLPAGRVRADHTGYRMGDGWIEPDASVTWPDQHKDEKYLTGAPMLAVEILSPGEEIERKLTLYFEEGALEVWVIDLQHRAMTVYVKRHDEVVRIVVRDQYQSEAVGVSLELKSLFL
jgi:Uma2 family endonuclease